VELWKCENGRKCGREGEEMGEEVPTLSIWGKSIPDTI
jgi:hypothetical protein